jgi:hypothetical protein
MPARVSAENSRRNWIALPVVAASKMNCLNVYDGCKIRCSLMHMNTTAEYLVKDFKLAFYCRNEYLRTVDGSSENSMSKIKGTDFENQ